MTAQQALRHLARILRKQAEQQPTDDELAMMTVGAPVDMPPELANYTAKVIATGCAGGLATAAALAEHTASMLDLTPAGPGAPMGELFGKTMNRGRNLPPHSNN